MLPEDSRNPATYSHGDMQQLLLKKAGGAGGASHHVSQLIGKKFTVQEVSSRCTVSSDEVRHQALNKIFIWESRYYYDHYDG